MRTIRAIAGVVVGLLVAALVTAFLKIEGKRWLHYLDSEYGNLGWSAGMLIMVGLFVIACAVVAKMEATRKKPTDPPVS